LTEERGREDGKGKWELTKEEGEGRGGTHQVWKQIDAYNGDAMQDAWLGSKFTAYRRMEVHFHLSDSYKCLH